MDLAVSSEPDSKGSIDVGEGYLSLEIKDSLPAEIKLRLYGKTKFSIVNEFPDLEEEEELNDVEFSYTSKSVADEIVEVWFPPESESSALEYPINLIKIDNNEVDDSWASLAENAVKIQAPSIKVDESEEKNDVHKVYTDGQKWINVLFSSVVYWFVHSVYPEDKSRRSSNFLKSKNKRETKEAGEEKWGLPSRELFQPSRPVNLKPEVVLNELQEHSKLYFPWHVIESACAALNAGKNVIFTGPPGCGKSKLAHFLAKKATGQNPLMATASPAWTTGDLLGRYMPSRDGNGLVFREGFFLRAIPRNGASKWLIIDEFNRADIDSCFGELFSVLAGDAVQLPFEQLLKDENSDEGGDPASVTSSFVRIVPAGASNVEEREGDYRVPNRFRLIGTMNDADRSGLNNLSFALMRRFAFIPVEAPDRDKIHKIIEKGIKLANKDLNLDKYSWFVVGDKKSIYGKSEMKKIENELKLLFANSKNDWGDLVSSRAVGVSVIQDIIRFVGEGIRSSGTGDKRYVDFRPVQSKTGKDRYHVAEVLSLSYLALAIVLQVFPQLESLGRGSLEEEDKLMKAIKHIYKSIHTGEDGSSRSASDLPMLRIAKNEDDKYEDRILESDQSIAEFLFDNLKTRLPNLNPTHLRNELAEWLPEDNS